MPYKSTADLPAAIRKRYGPKGRRAFLKTFNDVCYDDKKKHTEQSAFKIAHSAAQRAEAAVLKKKGKKKSVKSSVAKKQKAKRKAAATTPSKQNPIVSSMTAGMGGGY